MAIVHTSERDRLRNLAARLREEAEKPVMAERKRQWRALRDLRPERPMILFETGSVEGFTTPEELQCADPFLRAVERNMVETIRHAEELGDDIVVDPWFRLGWQMDIPGFGIDVRMESGYDEKNDASLGYTFNFPIKSPADLASLRERSFGVDREKTAGLKAVLEDTFGDILPTRVGNYDHFMGPAGDEAFCGCFFLGLTWQIFRFIGNDSLLYWFYDEPETIHALMRYMRDDRIALYRFLEREGLLVPNTDTQMAGPRAYGYVSDLPGPDSGGPSRLNQLWCWAEAQETVGISPAMYGEFILPYLSEITDMFGLVYYGCCEPIHDRLELVMKEIPNLRSVSVSGWSDLEKVAEMMGKRYVYSRKPTPALVSGENPPWELARDDMVRTYRATKDSCVELLFRDVYTVGSQLGRLKEWVSMTKAIFGI